jgi:imidazolonepropionase-like amidohydrolase
MGGRAGIDLALRDAINSGIIVGPRILASGHLICMTGGHGWPLGREADGPDEVRKAAREQLKAGADLVKFMSTGGILTPGVTPGSPQLTEEELRAGIEEAHKAGKKTATHAMGTEGILNALKAGIDSIEHGVYLNEEAVELMLQRNVTLVPTLSPLHHIYSRGREAGIPEYAVKKTETVRPHHLRSLEMAKSAGVHIVMGTDAGTPFNFHGENLMELYLLTQHGFTPMEALIASTSSAAKALGLHDSLGTVEERKEADLVLVKGSPLDDIGVLTDPQSVVMVVRSGKVVKDVVNLMNG